MVNLMKIKLLNENAKVPFRGSDMAAGYDLYSAEEIVIPVGECKLISTGIALEVPNNYFGGIFPRSGTAVKRGLRLANCVGVIDADYKDTIKCALYNYGDKDVTLEKDERFMQAVTTPYIVSIDEPVNKERTGGIGSTGK